MSKKEITIFIFGNYTPNSIRFSVSLGFARLLFILMCIAALVVIAAVGIVASGAYRFTRLAYLTRRNQQLEQEFKKLSQLQERLEFLEAEREKLARMLGVDLTPPPVDWHGAATDSFELPDWITNQPWGKYPVPILVPVSGYVISRRATPDHIAVDLAVPRDRPVRAAADGIVVARGTDRVLGRFLLLAHADGYETYYGHLSQWLVNQGDTVKVGQPIGKVGMTGQASAPHLHFEIRKFGKPLDPMEILKF
uniref:M23ase beta-sheet core domain-containing protein n=1 Tax=candidate division WOR-3 bacterium TaxID=2052148 RepID=A0A7V3PSI5_UNCW3